MYSKLNKMEVMQEEYIKFQLEKIHKKWFTFQSVSGTTDLQPPILFDISLREWLDDVLQLLNKEHTQSGDIFGKEYITSVTAKVLEECFRPILPSFQSRLINLYSLNEQTCNQGAETL